MNSQPSVSVDITQRLLHAVADGDRQRSWRIAADADRNELEQAVRYLCEAVRQAVALACDDDATVAAVAIRTIADRLPETQQFLDVVDELDDLGRPDQGEDGRLR